MNLQNEMMKLRLKAEQRKTNPAPKKEPKAREVSSPVVAVTNMMDEAQWFRDAERAVLKVAKALGVFSSDDVWEAGGLSTPANPRALGPVLKKLANDGIIETTGEYAVSRRRRGAPVMSWRYLKG